MNQMGTVRPLLPGRQAPDAEMSALSLVLKQVRGQGVELAVGWYLQGDGKTEHRGSGEAVVVVVP